MDRAFPDTESGDDLTKKVRERSIFRTPATAAIRKGYFEDGNGAAMDVPIGTRFSGDNLNYTVTEKIATGQFRLLCETPGAAGNQYQGNLFPIDYVEGLGAARLADILINGEDEESDEDLLDRYMDSLQAQAYGGNKADYSPAAVLGEIKEKGLEFKTSICESTLYSYIDKGVFLTVTNKNLPVKGQKKRPYHNVQRAKRPPAGTSIENRPKEIDDRAVVGDWEMDCVEGKKKTKKTLLVLTERKSRREIIRPMRDQTARSVVRVLDSLEREYGANFSKIFRTITVDNGSEFADCAGMEKSCRRKGNRTKIYYCHPYSSYERGSNENVNRMIRRWFPKGTDFRKVTAKAIQKVEDWINNYPREILGFRTAEAVFQEGVACLT